MASTDPLVLFLHGRYGIRDDLAWVAAQTPAPWRPVLLEAPVPLGDRFEWFAVADNGRDGALSADIAPAADALLQWVSENAGGARVGAVGWSQGGATALHMLRRAPGSLAFVATLGGFTSLDAERGDAALAERRPPVFWARGADDTVITAADVVRMHEFLPLHASLQEHVYAGTGHEITEAMAEDVLRFVARQALT
jgi:phospholipase/carboxylesterase